MLRRKKEVEAEAERLETPEAANKALSETAKVVHMREKEKGQEKKMPVLPKMPKLPKARPERPCECGCGDKTKSRFAPGHDSYVRAWAIRVERKIVKMSDTPEPQRPAIAAMMKERASKEQPREQAVN